MSSLASHIPVAPCLPRMRSAKTVQLLEIVVAEGEGNSGDPVREVTYYFRPNGDVVARCDDWKSQR